MFDVGFWELVLVGVVALLVVGPERLPKLARSAGLWIGRARRTLGAVKAEIDREIKAQELKEILEKQARSKPLTTIIEDLSADAFETKPLAGPAAAPSEGARADKASPGEADTGTGTAPGGPTMTPAIPGSTTPARPPAGLPATPGRASDPSD